MKKILSFTLTFLLILIPFASSENVIIYHNGTTQTTIIGEYLNESRTYSFHQNISSYKILSTYPAVEGYDLSFEKNEVIEFIKNTNLVSQIYLSFYANPKLSDSFIKAITQDTTYQQQESTVKSNISKNENSISISPQQPGYSAFIVQFESSNITYLSSHENTQLIILGYSNLNINKKIGINPNFKGINGIIPAQNLTYLKIKANNEINGKIDPIPTKILVANSIVKKPILWTLLIFITSSIVSSIFSSLIAFKGTRPMIWKFTIFGIYNALTFPAFWLLSCLKRIDQEFVENPIPEVQEVKLDRWKRWVIGVPIFLLSFIAAIWPISLALGLSEIYYRILFLPFFFYALIPFFIFFPLIIWGIFKGRKLLLFNVLFSILFLILSTLFSQILFVI